ncbi:MAG: ABC transporter permease [Thermoproteus sp.]
MRTARTFLNSLVALAAALAVGAAVIAASGYDPLASYSAMFLGPFSSPTFLFTALAYSAPLVLTGLTFAIGLKGGLFNIGAEGQVYMGALGAVLAAYMSRSWTALPLAFALGLALAVAWSLVPAFLKVKRGVNEVVSTIMMNWIAYWLVILLVSTTLANPNQPSESVEMPASARLPPLVPGSLLTPGIAMSYALALLVYFYLRRTVWGFRLSISGLNPVMARSYGIKPESAVIAAFALGGVTAGLAGVLQVVALPPSYSLAVNLANVYGLGFDGITAAMLGGGDPLGVLAASAFLGLIMEGATLMQAEAGTPYEFVQLIQGIVILLLSVKYIRERR